MPTALELGGKAYELFKRVRASRQPVPEPVPPPPTIIETRDYLLGLVKGRKPRKLQPGETVSLRDKTEDTGELIDNGIIVDLKVGNDGIPRVVTVFIGSHATAFKGEDIPEFPIAYDKHGRPPLFRKSKRTRVLNPGETERSGFNIRGTRRVYTVRP